MSELALMAAGAFAIAAIFGGLGLLVAGLLGSAKISYLLEQIAERDRQIDEYYKVVRELSAALKNVLAVIDRNHLVGRAEIDTVAVHAALSRCDGLASRSPSSESRMGTPMDDGRSANAAVA